MSLINCLDISYQIVKYIFRSKYKSKVDTNFNLECNQIRKKWNCNEQNHLVIQFYLKKSGKVYLVEEWNIIFEKQQMNNNIQEGLNNCNKLAQSTPLCKKSDNEIDHIIHLNENKRTDWIDPNIIQTSQIELSKKAAINVAYLSSFEIIEKQTQQLQNDSQFFQRNRYLSDDIEQVNHLKRSTDINGLRQYKKNKEIITKAMNRMNDSFSSNSSKNKSSNLLTIINKKDDVEILSSPEDAQKIIDEDENGDFEIQMIIDEQPIEKGQTIIINSKEKQQNLIIDFIIKVRNKQHHYNSQIQDTLSFIKKFY